MCRNKAMEKDQIKQVIANSYGLNDAQKRICDLGYRMDWRKLTTFIGKEQVDTSHWQPKHVRNSVGTAAKFKRSDDEIFTEDCLYTHWIRNRFKRKHPPTGCSTCGISEWLGKKLPLQIDHINGNKRDNRELNMRWLCPNCHSQTDTFNKGTRKEPIVPVSDSELLELFRTRCQSEIARLFNVPTYCVKKRLVQAGAL